MPVILLKVAQEVPIPPGVTCEVKSRRITVKGPRGELFRNFRHAQVTIRKTNKNTVLVEKNFDKKKRCAVVKTIAGHIRNLFLGVTKGFRYKMRLVYAHFPINATVTNGGRGIELRNYIGQKETRRLTVTEGVKILEPGHKDEIWLEGNDIEDVSHSAAHIWQSCRVTNKDIRKFLDGCYVFARGVIGDERPI